MATREDVRIFRGSIKIKVMQEKNELVVELFSGYANGIITDEECCDMIDLISY